MVAQSCRPRAASGLELRRALTRNDGCLLQGSPPLITPPARAIRHRRTVAVNWAAADQRVHDLALKLPTLINRIAGGGDDIGPIEPPTSFKIDDGHVGVIAEHDAALAMPEPHFLRGIVRQHLRNALKRKTTAEVALAQHHGKQRFESGTARRRAPDAPALPERSRWT